MNWWRVLSATTIAASVAGVAGCRGALTTFFDLPPESEQEQPEAPPPAAVTAALLAQVPADTVRPPIEDILDPDSATALLPKDHAGNIDWVAAVRTGVIRPRAALPERALPPGIANPFEFAFDFVYQGPDTSFDAHFPHSVHTEWLACQQCHPRIFPYRNTPVTMGEIFQGKFCAECHGKVSFPITTGCERCHQRLTMPGGRATPDLIGTILMRRVPPDSVEDAVALQTDMVEPATFPHWVHRIRFRCKVCHMELFEPRAGANAITMQNLADGEACGRCHDGVTAFRAGFGSCQRCHLDPEPGS